MAALAILAFPAHANTVGSISLIGCGSAGSGCPNGTYSFSIGATSATLTIHVTGPVNSQNNFVSAVNLGFTASSNIHVTGGSTSFGGTWTFTTGPVTNAGCGSSSGAFICAASSPGVHIAQGGTYTWTWNYTLVGNAPIASPSNVHIGVNYDPHNGFIVSQTGATNPVPEPGSLALLGTGLLSLAGIVRRRYLG